MSIVKKKEEKKWRDHAPIPLLRACCKIHVNYSLTGKFEDNSVRLDHR